MPGIGDCDVILNTTVTDKTQTRHARIQNILSDGSNTDNACFFFFFFFFGKVCYQLTGSSDFNVNSLIPVKFLFSF